MAESLETPNKKRDGHVPSPLQTLSSSTASLGRSPPPGLAMGSPSPHGHRGSFAEQMRGGPGSPRASRQPSLSQQAFQDLINNPPTKAGDPKFHGRDWRTIRLGEIVDPSLVRFVELDTSVEDATAVCIASSWLTRTLLTSTATRQVGRTERCPAPRECKHPPCNRHIRLQRSKRIPPPRSRPCTPRRTGRSIFRRAGKEGTRRKTYPAQGCQGFG